jgi:lysophospholipase L1-like esterase
MKIAIKLACIWALVTCSALIEARIPRPDSHGGYQVHGHHARHTPSLAEKSPNGIVANQTRPLDKTDFHKKEAFPDLEHKNTRYLASRATIADGVSLRIMPVGDSITHSYQGGNVNADGNGYRLQLWNLLTENPKDFIGTQSSGDMADPANEGYNGATIAEIAARIKGALPIRPNVLLVHAGTNDMNRPYEPETAPERLGNLIDLIVDACPDAAVLVAKIIPIRDPTAQARVEIFNAAVYGVVDSRARAGRKVMVVDMSSTVTVADLIDGLHPTNDRYARMGSIWHTAIESAARNGWIKAPIEGSLAGTVCSKQPVWYPQDQIASGICQSKGFSSVWYPKGEIASGIGKGAKVRFGDINGDKRDDYLFVKDDGAVEAYLNTKGATS